MKAFILAMVALVVIAVAASEILRHSGFSTADVASRDATVRLEAEDRAWYRFW